MAGFHFPEEVVDQAWNGSPAGWIAGEEDARLPELLTAACRAARTNPLPHWEWLDPSMQLRLSVVTPACAAAGLLRGEPTER